MIKMRIEGLPEEVQCFSDCLKNKIGLDILSESNNYPNRNSQYVRRYFDVELTYETKGSFIMKNNATIIAVANQV